MTARAGQRLSRAGAGGDLLPSLKFDTAELDADRAFEVWSGAMAGFAVSRTDESAPFSAVAEAWQLGPFVISRTRVGAVRAVRALRDIDQDQIDHYSVVTSVEGDWQASVAGQQFQLSPGSTCIFDKSLPFATVSTGLADVIIMLVPRPVLEPAEGAMDLHGHVLRNAAGRLLSDYLHVLVTRLPAMTEAEAPHVATATAAMLLSCVQATAAPDAAMQPANVVRRASRLVDSNLAEPITPETLQAALNLSRSSLYRAFEPLGGVAGFIRQRRLARIHALISAGNAGSVKSLAAEAGFVSAAQLTRAFRAHFGYSVSHLRSRSPAAPPDVPSAAVPNALASWVWSL